jgi:hypothetical protein
VNGTVPPVTVEVNVANVPTVPVVGPVTVTPRVVEVMVSCCDAAAVCALASVTVTDTVKVPDVE